jgi:hypothetical protein
LAKHAKCHLTRLLKVAQADARSVPNL